MDISQIVSYTSCGSTKERATGEKLCEAKFRESSDKTVSCRWCKHRGTILLNPSDPDESERKFTCKRHGFDFRLKIGELSKYVCDEYIDNEVITDGFKAFADATKKETHEGIEKGKSKKHTLASNIGTCLVFVLIGCVIAFVGTFLVLGALELLSAFSLGLFSFEVKNDWHICGIAAAIGAGLGFLLGLLVNKVDNSEKNSE